MDLFQQSSQFSIFCMGYNNVVYIVGEENPWMSLAQDTMYGSSDHLFIELHATAMLCLPSGECLRPDATLCTTLTSALYASISEEDVLKRQVTVCSYPFNANTISMELLDFYMHGIIWL